MKRILIIGNAGAGKTTFALALKDKINVPVVHLDRLFWKDNWNYICAEEFDELLEKALVKQEWIIDGNYNRTLRYRMNYCDKVFYFDFPTATCLWGITKRIFQNYGKSRADMGGKCPEYFDRQKLYLYKSVFGFNRRHRKEYHRLLKTRNNSINVVVFKNRAQVKKYLEK